MQRKQLHEKAISFYCKVIYVNHQFFSNQVRIITHFPSNHFELQGYLYHLKEFKVKFYSNKFDLCHELIKEFCSIFLVSPISNRYIKIYWKIYKELAEKDLKLL